MRLPGSAKGKFGQACRLVSLQGTLIKCKSLKIFFARSIFLHVKLDEYLFDTELVHAKRNNYNAKQLAVDAEVQCPVCDKLMPKPRLREHCTRHFAEEITAIVHSFNKQEVCGLCDTKPRYVSARTWGDSS